MTYPLIVKNRATQDLRQAANYILVHGTIDAAERFLAAAESTFAQLANTPGMGKRVQLVAPVMGQVRQWRIKGFPDHLIFYRFQDDQVTIIRVLHGARDLDDILPNLEDEA